MWKLKMNLKFLIATVLFILGNILAEISDNNGCQERFV